MQALVATCANEIGATRTFYSTRDHADDIDAVRQALGVNKVALWGTSYGTQLSVAYAYTYPQHVERLLLDSVADPAGRDPFSTNDLQEMPKGLAALCRSGVCRTATPSFVGELVRLENRIATHPLAGRIPRPGGGTKVVRATAVDLLSGAVLDSDLNPGLAAELPAAVHAALAGRVQPLVRLLITPGVGHSVLGADLSGCVENAVKTWLSGGVPPAVCKRSPLLVGQVATFPRSVASLRPAAGVGGLRGRTLRAVATSLQEA